MYRCVDRIQGVPVWSLFIDTSCERCVQQGRKERAEGLVPHLHPNGETDDDKYVACSTPCHLGDRTRDHIQGMYELTTARQCASQQSQQNKDMSSNPTRSLQYCLAFLCIHDQNTPSSAVKQRNALN